MYNITLPILGTRLKQIREHIGYSQAQLAEQLNCKQNAISNLELGKGGSLKLLFQVLNFYSNYVFIDLIFSEKFYLISNTEEDEAQKANYNSVIIEIIRQSEKNYEDILRNCRTISNNTNIWIIGVPEEEEEKKENEEILEEIIVENFPSIAKEIVNQIQEA